MANSEDDELSDGRTSKPRARLRQEIDDQVDAIEAEFGREGYQIGRVITILEVVGPDSNVGIRIRAAQLPWVTLGLLRAAERIIERQITGQ
jgi:hypothetical protein